MLEEALTCLDEEEGCSPLWTRINAHLANLKETIDPAWVNIVRFLKSCLTLQCLHQALGLLGLFLYIKRFLVTTIPGLKEECHRCSG